MFCEYPSFCICLHVVCYLLTGTPPLQFEDRLEFAKKLISSKQFSQSSDNNLVPRYIFSNSKLERKSLAKCKNIRCHVKVCLIYVIFLLQKASMRLVTVSILVHVDMRQRADYQMAVCDKLGTFLHSTRGFM